MSADRKKILVVLGMHRSGTSALTRGLQTLGAELGENLMPAFEGNNSKGFWEDLEIVAINDSLLEQLEQDWQSLDLLGETDWQKNLEHSPLGQRARDYLQAQLKRYRLFGIKDPRMARLLPFWKAIFEQLEIDPIFLISSRNPISVARSLEKRDALPAAKSYLLWLAHSLPSLQETQGYTRLVVNFDRLLDAPRAQLLRIARQTGLAEPDGNALDEYAESFLDDQLRHSHFSGADLQHDDRLSAEVAETFALLERLATDELSPDDAQVQSTLTDLQKRLKSQAPALNLLGLLDRQLSGLHSLVQRHQQDFADQADSLRRQQERNAELENSLHQQQERNAELENSLHQQQERNADLENNLHQQQERNDDLESAVAALNEALAAAQASIAEIFSSSSWRLTQPLRLLATQINDALFRGRQAILRLGRATYRRLPPRWRDRLLYRSFATFGFLFRGLAPYENWVRQYRTGERPADEQYDLQFVAIGEQADDATPNSRSGRYALRPSLGNDYCYLPPRRDAEIDRELAAFPRQPRVSIITPVYGIAPLYLKKLIQSVENQWYGHWELILVEDAGPNEDTRDFLRKLRHPRIQVRLLEQNGGISAASNTALGMARGEYVVFLDHDDELTADALYEVVKAINAEDPDFIYSDEDKIDAQGRFSAPFFKPGWSPDAMMSIMYTCHLCCIRKTLIDAVGGLRVGYEGAQDYDLILRITEQTQHIHHIPKILYHWRILPSSIASGIEAKPYACDAIKRLKEDALARRQLSGSIEPVAQMPGQFRVNYRPLNSPLVSIIIPTRDNWKVLKQCIDSILEKTQYGHYEIVLMDNQTVDKDSLDFYALLQQNSKINIQKFPKAFNYSEINNAACQYASGEYFVFLNDDTEVLTGDWLERLLGFAQLAHIGAVGAKLLFPKSLKIQHCGVLNLADGPGHAFYNASAEQPLYFGRNMLDWNWLAVTGACLMIARNKYEAIGGFDESFPIAYNDIDLCLRLHKQGLHNVVCSAVTLLHYESVSRGIDHQDSAKHQRLKKERRNLYRKHSEYFMVDPYFNKNLHQNSVDFLTPNY